MIGQVLGKQLDGLLMVIINLAVVSATKNLELAVFSFKKAFKLFHMIGACSRYDVTRTLIDEMIGHYSLVMPTGRLRIMQKQQNNS